MQECVKFTRLHFSQLWYSRYGISFLRFEKSFICKNKDLHPKFICLTFGNIGHEFHQKKIFTFCQNYFAVFGIISPWKNALLFNWTNQCYVQQSERPRTLADWTIALTSFSIVQSANVRGSSLCWTQHWFLFTKGWFVPSSVKNGSGDDFFNLVDSKCIFVVSLSSTLEKGHASVCE